MSNYVEFVKPSYSAVKSVNGKVGAVVLTAEDLDLEGMASEEYVNQKIAEAQLNETDVDLSAYYTKSQTDAKIKQAVDAIPEPDLSNYATKAYVSNAIPSLDGYATENYVQEKIAEAKLEGEDVDLSDYAKKSEIPTKVGQLENDKGYLTEHQSLAGYATETFVTQKITEAQLGGEEVDLSDYYTKSEVDAKIPSLEGYAKTTDIPDVSGYTTMSAVEAKGYQTEAQVSAAITAALDAIGNAEEGAY